VGSLVVYECANCGVNPDIGPANPALAALPGLTKLQRFRNFFPLPSPPLPLGSFILRNTALTDLTSFVGLQCPAGFFQITSNARLSTFQGFNGLQPPTFIPGSIGSSFIATGNSLLNYQSVSAIKNLAGCPSNLTSPFSNSFYVITAACVLPVGGPATGTRCIRMNVKRLRSLALSLLD
jgi:hypothetical protein